MVHFELYACRRLLMLELGEAAEHIGCVAPEVWHRWETGAAEIPDDVEFDVFALIQLRNELLSALREEREARSFSEIRWYCTFDDFKHDFPNFEYVKWRVYQSAVATLFTNGDLELSTTTTLEPTAFAVLSNSSQIDAQ